MPKHGGGNPNDKPNNFNLAVKKLMHYLNKYKFRIIFALIFSAFSSVLAIISPKRLEKLINTIIAGIITGIDMDKVKEIMFALIIIYALSAIFDYLEKYLMVDATNKFAKELRENISHKINKLPLKYFDTHTSGDILSRVTNDIDTVSQNLNNSLSTFVSAITLLVGCLIMMFKTNWIMALTSIFSSLLGLVLMMIILSKAQKYFVMRQEELGKLNGHIEEMYSGHLLVKTYNYEDKSIESYVSTQTPFGFVTTYRGKADYFNNALSLYSSGGISYVKREDVKRNSQWIDCYKVIFSKATCEHAGTPDKTGRYRVFSTMKILKPQEICTQSYLVGGTFNSQEEAENYLLYLKTCFVRFLMLQLLSTQDISAEKFRFVPLQDFTKPWTDEELYKKYNLTDEEIQFIESMIKPME